jgi:hypothetical protein
MNVNVACWNFTAEIDDVDISSVCFERTGVASTADIVSLNLFEEGEAVTFPQVYNRLEEGRYCFDLAFMTGMRNHTGDAVRIPAWSEVVWCLNADFDAQTPGGEHAFRLASADDITLLEDSYVSSSFPQTGNTFTIVEPPTGVGGAGGAGGQGGTSSTGGSPATGGAGGEAGSAGSENLPNLNVSLSPTSTQDAIIFPGQGSYNVLSIDLTTGDAEVSFRGLTVTRFGTSTSLINSVLVNDGFGWYVFLADVDNSTGTIRITPGGDSLRILQPNSTRTLDVYVWFANHDGGTVQFGMDDVPTFGRTDNVDADAFVDGAFPIAGGTFTLTQTWILPTLTGMPLQSGVLVNEETEIARWQVAAFQGLSAAWKAMVLHVDADGVSALQSLQLYRGSEPVSGAQLVVHSNPPVNQTWTAVLTVVLGFEEVVTDAGTIYSLRAVPMLTDPNASLAVSWERNPHSEDVRVTGGIADSWLAGTIGAAIWIDENGDAYGDTATYFLWSDMSGVMHSDATVLNNGSLDWISDWGIDDTLEWNLAS